MPHACRALTAEAESDQLLSWLTVHCHDETDLLLASTVITTTLTMLVTKTGDLKKLNVTVNFTKFNDKITVAFNWKKAVKISQKLILFPYRYLHLYLRGGQHANRHWGNKLILLMAYSFCNQTIRESFSSSHLNKLKFWWPLEKDISLFVDLLYNVLLVVWT